MKAEANKLKKHLAELNRDLLYTAGYLEALKDPIPEHHKAEIIARLSLETKILEQRIIKAAKQLKKETDNIKKVYIYASNN